MKKLVPPIGLFYLLLLPLLGRAQAVQFSGWIFDADLKTPVPYASLTLRTLNRSVLTDEKGYFRFIDLKPFKQDSIIVKTLGFEPYSALITSNTFNDLTIELKRRYPEKAEASVTNFVCNLSSHNPEPYAERELSSGIPDRQFAFFIANDKRKQFGKLQTVSFYIDENGLPMKPFRIRIYKADGNYYSPKTALLNEGLFINANSPGKWYSINLSRYNIAVPEDGYFVALEFSNPTNSLAQPILVNYIPSGLVMRPALKYRKSTTWSYRPEKFWSLCPKTEGLHRFDAMVKVEVEPVE